MIKHFHSDQIFSQWSNWRQRGEQVRHGEKKMLGKLCSANLLRLVAHKFRFFHSLLYYFHSVWNVTFSNIFASSVTSLFIISHRENRANELLNFLKLLQSAASLHCLLVLVSRRRILHKNTSGDIPSGNPLAKFLQETLLRSSFRKTLAILFQENLFLRR